MHTGIQSFSQFHVNSKSKLYSQLWNKGFYIICLPQSPCMYHTWTNLNEERSLGLKCNKTQSSQHFLAKRVIDPEKTTTANCLGLSHAPLNNKNGNKYFLQLKQFSLQNCCINVHFKRQWACISLSSAVTSGTFSNKLSSSRSMSSCMTEASNNKIITILKAVTQQYGPLTGASDLGHVIVE